MARSPSPNSTGTALRWRGGLPHIPIRVTGVWSPTTWRAYGLLYYAVPRAGRILALINQRLDAAEQASQIAVSDPRIPAGDRAYLDALNVSGSRVRVRLHRMATGAGSFRCSRDRRRPRMTRRGWCSPAARQVRQGPYTHRSLAAAVRGTVEGRSVPAGDVYLFPFPDVSSPDTTCWSGTPRALRCCWPGSFDRRVRRDGQRLPGGVLLAGPDHAARCWAIWAGPRTRCPRCGRSRTARQPSRRI